MTDTRLSMTPGCYVLTREGELRYDAGGQWRTDNQFTPVFRQYSRRLLAAYLAGAGTEADWDGVRIAVIGCPHDHKNRWRSTSLILETPALRTLYPVHRSRPGELTEFQKRSRRHSLYRGMELLLEYRKESLPDAPVFCPVLFDRGTTLDRYASLLDREPDDADTRTPVMEVLNLLALIPMSQRDDGVVEALVRRIHRQVIDKAMRRQPAFSLSQGERRSPFMRAVFGGGLDLGAASREAAAAPARSPAATRAGSEACDVSAQQPRAGAAEPRAGVRKIARGVSPALLKGFDALRKLDLDVLAELASHCRLYAALPGTRILEQGSSDNGALFLLEGKLQLKAVDGARFVIESGSRQARAPVAQLKPRLYSVTALTAVTFVWLHEGRLKAAWAQLAREPYWAGWRSAMAVLD